MNAGAVTEDNTAKLTLGTKLKLARSLTGLSTRAVAERLRPHHEVSHATIANYEKGDSTPPMAILVALAQLYDRPISWFLERSLGLSGVRYRNLKSRTKSSDLLRFEAETQQWLDAYIAVERRLNRPLTPKCSFPKVPANADVTEVAQDVRRLLNFASDAPIASIVEVLESFGVRVIEVPTALRIDGLAAVYGDQHIVALNSTVSGDRSRMNAAHEFAHIIYGDCSTEGHHSPEEEKRAFTFASTLLLPNSELKRAFEGYSMVRLVQFKERFGISLAAMVYRAEQLGFIQKKVAKDLWIAFAKKGWRTNEPGSVGPDRATRFEQLVEEIVSSGGMSIKELADVCGIRPQALRQRLDAAMGLGKTFEDSEEQVFPFPGGH